MTSDRTPAVPPSGGDLARLLETETRLEELLRRTRGEGARLVAEAEQSARAREQALAAELEETARRLEGEIAAERASRERDVAAAAQREAEGFERVPAERVGELARYVVDRVIAGGGGE